MNKYLIIGLLMITLLSMVGCEAVPEHQSKCRSFCRNAGMDFSQVTELTYSGPYCYCVIHIDDINNKQTII